ncbi:MAG: hypothetical protein EBY32_18130, partial [Proteobacteria bacterium]|nr:hypothetical protein [Pseudomonadota bacterium]
MEILELVMEQQVAILEVDQIQLVMVEISLEMVVPGFTILFIMIQLQILFKLEIGIMVLVVVVVVKVLVVVVVVGVVIKQQPKVVVEQVDVLHVAV